MLSLAAAAASAKAAAAAVATPAGWFLATHGCIPFFDIHQFQKRSGSIVV